MQKSPAVLCFATIAVLAVGTPADSAPCPKLGLVALGRVFLPCAVSNEKVLVITNNTGHTIDTGKTPVSFDAVRKPDGLHYCGSFNGGAVAAGRVIEKGLFPMLSCKAWYRPATLMRQ
jgi:hypothetical protein